MKIFAIFFLLTMSAGVAFASCNDLGFYASYQKDSTGCYENVQFNLQRFNCTQNCLNYTKYSIYTDKGIIRDINISDPSIISNQLVMFLSKVNCSKGAPLFFYIDLKDENESCTLPYRIGNATVNQEATEPSKDTPKGESGKSSSGGSFKNSNTLATPNKTKELPAYIQESNNLSRKAEDVVPKNPDVISLGETAKENVSSSDNSTASKVLGKSVFPQRIITTALFFIIIAILAVLTFIFLKKGNDAKRKKTNKR